MKLIAGLGNPGTEYANTRHNVGFMVLDALAGMFGEKVNRKKFNALTEEVMAGDVKLLLVKPQQYMNRSGFSIATAAGFYKLDPSDVLVVTDDLALDVGKLRVRTQGGSGGHNGLKDIISKLGTDGFSRLRIGIGDAGRMDSADYVLGRFGSDDREIIDKSVQLAAKAVLCWAQEGAEPAMTQYNGRGGQ
ncbi:MAG: aminoacyl-tRNA hydrolase [Planctomycetota bacterium]